MKKVKIINKSCNQLPTYSTPQSAGLDLQVNVKNKIRLKPLERKVLPTGIFIELPEGYEAQIRPRSGMAANFGLGILNSPGTIDADYRGEIKLIIINLSNQDITIDAGARIAQMVINRYEKIVWQEVNNLSSTLREEGGFGHTDLT